MITPISYCIECTDGSESDSDRSPAMRLINNKTDPGEVISSISKTGHFVTHTYYAKCPYKVSLIPCDKKLIAGSPADQVLTILREQDGHELPLCRLKYRVYYRYADYKSQKSKDKKYGNALFIALRDFYPLLNHMAQNGHIRFTQYSDWAEKHCAGKVCDKERGNMTSDSSMPVFL